MLLFFFFFSSRRRHTRSDRDWSSDVCSSDLPLHGNVETRLRRLDDGAADAIVLAAAGIDRLGMRARIDVTFEPDVLAPAPGQGALAVQVRRGDTRLMELVSAIDDGDVRLAVEAEREVLRATG